MPACECVLVFVLHPTSCPRLRLSSSTTWWGRVGGGGCEGIRQLVPSLPGSQRLTLCDLITRPLVGTATLMLPGPTNQFASSKGKQPHLWEGCLQLHIRYVQYMHANVDAPQHKATPIIFLTHGWRAGTMAEIHRKQSGGATKKFFYGLIWWYCIFFDNRSINCHKIDGYESQNWCL